MGLVRKPTEDEVEHTRRIARKHYLQCEGDYRKYKKGVRAEIKQEYGSILLYLTIAAVLLQIAYTLWKWWRDAKIKEPPELMPLSEWQYLQKTGAYKR